MQVGKFPWRCPATTLYGAHYQSPTADLLTRCPFSHQAANRAPHSQNGNFRSLSGGRSGALRNQYSGPGPIPAQVVRAVDFQERFEMNQSPGESFQKRCELDLTLEKHNKIRGLDRYSGC